MLKSAAWPLVATDVSVCAIETLQQSKVYQKEQRRQFKELKELVRRHQKKTSELLREFNNKYKKMTRQCSKSRYTHVCNRTFLDQNLLCFLVKLSCVSV